MKDIKYFIYCRKSSEDSQKQVASIEDQKNALKQLSNREKLKVVEQFTEERSAKDPGRPVFNQMLDLIEEGEANALICWDIDRLSRNPIDNGKLQWMLQKGVIRAIKTPGRSYYPEDAGLLMSIEGGRATDFVMRLSKNVKRGLNSKAMRGWRPSGGPIGYLNIGTEKGNKTIASDPERFHLVRKMWDLFLTGTYSVSKILDIATNEWGLRTLKRRKIGGKPLTMSHMYRIFNDSFYYGYFPWIDSETNTEKMIKGRHEPMITESEYWRAQALLGKKGKPRAQTREFAFTGLMTCGECGGSVTAEEKNQMICSCKYKFAYENKDECPKCKTPVNEIVNPKILNYTYYHCIKKPNKNCTQKSIRLEDLEDQFVGELQKLTIDKEYLDLALEYLHDKQSDSSIEEISIRKSLESSYESCQVRLKNLNREYTSPLNSDYSLYSPEDFSKQKRELITERDNIQKEMEKIKEKLDGSLEATERTFNFCAFALHHFNNGDIQKKRSIFSTISSNIYLKGKKISINKLNPFMLIENELSEQRKLFKELEPKISDVNKRKKAVFDALSPNWLGR